MKQSRFNIDANIVPAYANDSIREEIRDYYPVFYNAFAWFTQLVVNKHDQSCENKLIKI